MSEQTAKNERSNDNLNSLVGLGFEECETGRWRRCDQHDGLCVRLLCDGEVIEVMHEQEVPHYLNVITTFAKAEDFELWLKLTDSH